MAISAASSKIARVAGREVKVLKVIFAMIGGWRSESGLGLRSQWSLMRFCGLRTPNHLGVLGVVVSLGRLSSMSVCK